MTHRYLPNHQSHPHSLIPNPHSPIRKRPVQPAHLGQLGHTEGMGLGGFPVKLNAEPGRGRGQQVAVLPGRLDRNHIGEDGAGPARLLLDRKVGAGEIQMQTGCR